MEYKYIVGVDEVGRGPLAGPVYVCACKIAVDALEDLVTGTDLPIRDSKKLTEKTRKKWFEYLQQKKKDRIVSYVVSGVSAKEIDSKGIAVCIKYAVNQSVRNLVDEKDRSKSLVLLDGGLVAPPEFAQQTIIRGDEKEAVISFASILAKVLRDEYMTDLHKEYPHYGFSDHKGYGTAKHMDAIRKFGTIKEHRVSFLRNI